MVTAGVLRVLGGTIRPFGRSEATSLPGEHSLMLGRHRTCHLVLDDPRVSAVHAEMTASVDGVRLRDLGSTNGTYVGGVRVSEVFLDTRTVFRVASTNILFEPCAVEVAMAEVPRFGALVGQSQVMRALFSRLQRVAPTDLTVLLGGETGTGKELAARAIHEASARAKGPFVVVDCASIPASLAESTLFGHEKGAFTGATDRRTSPFVEATGGTIFLDELGELPIDLQPKLLRALAERRIKPVGGSTYRPVDVRVVAATRRNLAREVNDGAFRSDLFFRLAEVQVEMPSLRARLDDIPILVGAMLRELGDADGLARVSGDELARLIRHDWPGNVRELRNAVSVAYALSDGGALEIAPHLGALSAPRASDELIELAAPPPPPRGSGIAMHSVSFKDAKQDSLTRFEREYFGSLHRETGGNVSEMARRSGLERAHVRMYLRRHGIVP